MSRRAVAFVATSVLAGLAALALEEGKLAVILIVGGVVKLAAAYVGPLRSPAAVSRAAWIVSGVFLALGVLGALGVLATSTTGIVLAFLTALLSARLARRAHRDSRIAEQA